VYEVGILANGFGIVDRGSGVYLDPGFE
jgi:hypothetical protein